MQPNHDRTTQKGSSNSELTLVSDKLRSYSSPALISYGSIARLTQTGSVARVENGGHPEGKL